MNSLRAAAVLAMLSGRWPGRPLGSWGCLTLMPGPWTRSVIHFAIWAPAGAGDRL